MNDIPALQGAANQMLANSLVTRASDSGSSLFADQLSMLLAQTMLEKAAGSFSTNGSGQAAALSQTGLLSGMMQNQDADSTMLLLCMLMMNGEGSKSAGMMAALSSLASAGTSGTLSTKGLSTAAAAYRSAPGTAATAQSGDGIPYDAWKPVNPALTNSPGARSASDYRAVIDQFGVENNGRYRVNKQGNNDTYCNIFVWDVTRAMGAEIPHYVDAETQAPRSYPDTAGTYCMTANTMAGWLEETGREYGWKRVSAEEAQRYANRGCPAVTVWKNTGGHGHVQVVCPSQDGTYDAQKGVSVAQAGRRLYNYAHITQVYSKNTLHDIAYYVHV